ncbi:patatin-like phospholipase family protein [Posidoniimonas corsicana]|uniref:patatin-like phospholipase family protein n=1 Tax=Posidoniimonas corsicana TaxID=1938618 RepID=UPI0011B6CD8E|nr:patatin-like phospholipase family protein [Posidoniimonas corsicana]
MTYKILSLDGGGIRGLFQAEFLRHFEDAVGKPVRECFDMVAGTSTGSIVTMGIVNGVALSKISQVFKSDGKAIFRKGIEDRVPVYNQVVRRGPKYATEPLRRALSGVLGDTKLSDAKCDVVIPSVCLNDYRCKVFSNLHDSDRTLSTVDVALSSSAAPTYFPSVQPHGSSRTYVAL